MVNTVMFLGWNTPVHGREMIVNELFTSFVNYLTKCQTSKLIESFEPVLLHPHGGDLNGFILVRGTRDQITKLRLTEDFLQLITQASVHVNNFGMVDGWIGDSLTEQMTRWQRYIAPVAPVVK
jgi:hypothetical protein